MLISVSFVFLLYRETFKGHLQILPVSESKMVMNVVQAKAFSLSSVVFAFEDASGCLSNLRVKRVERSGSVHLCVVVLDGDAGKLITGKCIKKI